MKIETMTGNTAREEFTYKILDIKAEPFWKYWVWSCNKVGTDPAGDVMASSALYKLYFQVPVFVPPSDNADPVQMIIEFSRAILPEFSHGFAEDLGTGLPHRTDLPCLHRGFTLISGATKLKCRLFIGAYPNPTKIIVTDFA